MPKRKRGLTTEEIQKVLADLEDEIFDDSDSDCELENEEDDLDQSLNLNPEVEDEVVSEEQIRKITEETNIYATRVLQSATPSSLRKHNPGWTETSEEEILKFLSLILLMGHVDKDNIKEYWSTDPMLETPFFKKIMPRDRFLNLLRYLHFENNDHAPDKTASDYDRLWKLRNVFNSLNNSFQEIYDPTEDGVSTTALLLLSADVWCHKSAPKKGRVKFARSAVFKGIFLTKTAVSKRLRALREGKDLQGREAQYTIEDGCIMYGQRVCIPRKFRKDVLEELHAGHLGIVKMKVIARSFVNWKNIGNDIEEAAKNCVDCARYKADPLQNLKFITGNIPKTIECLRDSFARFGLPRVLVSDNGSQFTSYEFQRFMHKNGVKHKTSAPFKPSSNGQAERYVVTLKQSIRAMHKYEGTIQQKLSTFLMQYRKAPNVTTTLSPAMLFLKRDIRARIDLLLPELKTKIQDKLRRDNFEFRDRKFYVGDRVAVRVYRAANTRWKFGTIVNQDGVLHYIIDVQGTLVRPHVDQIRPVGDKVQENIIPLMHQRFPSSEVRENNSNIQHAETAEDISKDLNKELGSSSVQGVPSTDVEVPDLSQSSAKETDSETRSPPVPDRPFPRRSGRIRRPPERLVL
ncbi:uncharacterized protein K02A2.6 [Trichonephila clavipes]|nr:uncharacterized protein K02A2.6 [Trichonephila clavipes]